MSVVETVSTKVRSENIQAKGFEFRLCDAQEFVSLLKVVDAGLDTSGNGVEINLQVTPENIRIRQMDASHVAMVDVTIEPRSCETYRVSGSSMVRVDLAELLKVLKNVGKDDALNFRFEPDSMSEKANLEIKVLSSNFRKIKIPLSEPTDSELVPEPKFAFNVKVNMESKRLAKVIAEAQEYDDKILFETRSRDDRNSDLMIFKAKTETREVEFELCRNDGSLYEIDIRENGKAVYNLDMLSPLVKAVKNMTDTVTVEFSKDMPMLLTAQNNLAQVKYYLAPRIPDE